MKAYVFFIFMVIHTIAAEKALSKLRRKLIVPKIDDKCRKIKCASVDEPECVRMKRNDLGFDVHIIVVNKCELYYMQCHDNVEAKIVPMKFCSHRHGQTSKKILKDKSHLRVKRKANDEDEKANLKAMEMVKMKHKKAPTKTEIMSKKSMSGKKKKPLKITKNTNTKKNSHLNLLGAAYSSADMERDQQRKDINDDVKNIEHIQLDLKSTNQIRKTEKLDLPDFPMLSHESNLGDMVKDANLKEYTADCPTVCPTRDVLVCARCQHGIFKTFISVCHMRMFACRHKDEILQLVSRSPCILSAPYLSEDGMIPRGRVAEAGDDDIILRYIICRDNENMGTDGKSGDPRCSFPLVITTSKYFYDFRNVPHPLDPHLVTTKSDLKEAVKTKTD
ncbi:uncharacterized protein LOC111361600 isoform X2 [Spodoptera litura]|uniref:Uncharacterized protein LOC111361600 isoform X2 n=1 Tax=Spodoptera litura TaxID=69820 RepID=A0A9J7ES74_SPOLT|nr:uncharacterized protein LOC111361600 isoform X2 [Spodoptera litura]